MMYVRGTENATAFLLRDCSLKMRLRQMQEWWVQGRRDMRRSAGTSSDNVCGAVDRQLASRPAAACCPSANKRCGGGGGGGGGHIIMSSSSSSSSSTFTLGIATRAGRAIV
jgi:hypothetical protein